MSYYASQSGVPSWESLERAEEDEDLDNSEYAYASRDHILFCIDASRSMQTPYPDQETPRGTIRGKSALHQVLDAVVKIERSKVITGPADSVGLLFYNIDAAHKYSTAPMSTQSYSAGNYKPGTLVYSNLRTINAEEIKRIIKLKERADDEYSAQDGDEDTTQPTALSKEFPPCREKDELNIADVLVTCNFLFRDAGTKLAGNKRIFLVTDQDSPPGGTNRAPARTVFGDLSTYGITINTFWIDKPDHKFDPSLYWNDVLNRDDEEDKPADAEPDLDGLSALADMMLDLVIRNAPKRVQFHIPLRIGGKDGDIEIGVSGYSMISEQGKGAPKYVRMRGQQVEEVVVKTEYTSAETGAVLRPEEMSSAYQFGHQATVQNVLETNWWESDANHALQDQLATEALKREQQKRREWERDGADEDMVATSNEPKLDQAAPNRPGGSDQRVTARTRLTFTPDEVVQFKSLGIPSGIKILGFQSQDKIQIQDNIRHAYFIYPDEDTYTGSTRTFAALLKSCIKLKRHALALCRFRANSLPEFCVMIPQEETFTADGGQDDPPGFHLVPLPFRDDIRVPPKNMSDNLQANEVQTKLMSAIVKRLRIKIGRYRSEVYPNPALAHHYAQLQALAFEEDFDLSQKIDEIDRTYPKYNGMHQVAGDYMAEWKQAIEEDERCQYEGKAGGGRGGKREADEGDEAMAAVVESAHKSGGLEKLRVADLRAWARVHEVSLQGKTKKAEMIELLQDAIPKHTQAKKTKT